jgi:hypothetical protein
MSGGCRQTGGGEASHGERRGGRENFRQSISAASFNHFIISALRVNAVFCRKLVITTFGRRAIVMSQRALRHFVDSDTSRFLGLTRTRRTFNENIRLDRAEYSLVFNTPIRPFGQAARRRIAIKPLGRRYRPLPKPPGGCGVGRCVLNIAGGLIDQLPNLSASTGNSHATWMVGSAGQHFARTIGDGLRRSTIGDRLRRSAFNDMQE